jgi:hypothetical protein
MGIADTVLGIADTVAGIANMRKSGTTFPKVVPLSGGNSCLVTGYSCLAIGIS